jgi:predicted  nucleic acid-binding Zn-ribbon protein
MPEDIIPEEVVDRGDLIPEDTAAEVTDPEVVADAAVEELTAELEAEKDEADDKKAKKDSRIPLSRHKEILEKEREHRADLERKLAQYQQGGQIADFNEQLTAAENNIMKMEKEYASLLTDGEIDKATALMAQIRRTEREMAEAKSDMKIHAAEIRNTERARYNISLERIEAAFPTLNPDHADYDEEAMAEVADLKSAYEMKGLTPTQALQKAVKLIVEPRTTKQEVATTSAPRVTEKDVAAERKTAAVKKVADAVAKQPPSLAKVGLNSDKAGGGRIDARAVMNMSQKEFASLNDETLAQMRGDTL